MTKEQILVIIEKVFEPFNHLEWYDKMIINTKNDDDYKEAIFKWMSFDMSPGFLFPWLFHWSSSPEGLDYWNEIYKLLMILYPDIPDFPIRK